MASLVPLVLCMYDLTALKVIYRTIDRISILFFNFKIEAFSKLQFLKSIHGDLRDWRNMVFFAIIEREWALENI